VTGWAAGVIDRAVSREEDWVDRVWDVSFLLDSLPEVERRVPSLTGKMDSTRIGVGGHSLGAYTAQVVGGATVRLKGQDEPRGFADRRVRAVLQLSGQGRDQQGLHEHSWEGMGLPMMCVTGSLDRGAQGQPPTWRRDPFALSPAGDKYFLFIQGAHHGSFTGRFAGGGASPLAEALRSRLEQRLERQLTDQEFRQLQDRLAQRGSREAVGDDSRDQSAIFAWVEQATTAFWDAYLKDDSQARAWLHSGALASAAKGRLRLERR
jgi:hypothetical protein